MQIGNVSIENRTGFPMEIQGTVMLDQSDNPKAVKLVILQSDGIEQPPLVGKVSGIQLRAIAAIDQLETMLQGDMAKVIRSLAMSANDEELEVFLRHEFLKDEESPNFNAFLTTVRAMAVFCYRELVDRGMLPPHSSEPTQEPNDGDDDE